ncbi:hypothetical protein G6F46_008310 [Rhizopus delemar]|uniref:Carotenoid oxygenase n=2 Tax=Rhizopus TaxID=4842 RepID=A0A9P6YXM1_9FUNG|nr:hypothetical protein G6F55_009509 [Rhizopus delemar]KAG1537354.1 hypothetical protein G6F51_010422 [Rhizopus arrhizus]KAG1520913.1 hypothetical protein G6F52_007222 [Rhizopus delemar]KAG1554757.1 hypothetical protein G6F49_007741 [Rhizopus delemar]KAG1566513.1 hypothetical protein G6F50_009075 [Rhizopus delemar]
MSDIEDTNPSLQIQSEPDYPLQPIVAKDDTSIVDNRSLLNDQGQPNLSRTPSATVPDESTKEDASHTKGFCNTTDSKQVVDLEVDGQLPDWLASEHYTIGPGTYDVKYTRKIEIDGILQSATATFTLGHWFDADHHGYAPNFPAGLFKTHPNQTMLIKFLNNGKKPKPDRVPCNQRIMTQVPGLDGRLFTQNFANHIQELDPFDLTPTQVQTWDEINADFKGYSSSPNGQVDPETGEYINFTMEIGYRTTRYHFFSISNQEPKGHPITTIWNAPTGWVNGFTLTPNYIVMVIHPMLANSGAVRFAWNESVLDSFTFYPSEPTLFYVISRVDKEVIACYRSNACFSLNQVNAYEDVHGNVTVDMVCYEDDTIVHRFATEKMRDADMERLPSSEVRRFVLANPRHEANKIYLDNNSYIPSAISVTSRIGTVWNYVTGQAGQPENATGSAGWHAWMPVVKYERISEATLELPQVNPLYKMRKYSFAYGLGNTGNSKMWDSIIKLDVNNSTVVASWHEANCYPSEAQFIPKPKDQAAEKDEEEDSGVLISVVMDAARNTSFLLVLNAQDLSVIAKSQLNKLIPLSFAHGSYRLRSTS